MTCDEFKVKTGPGTHPDLVTRGELAEIFAHVIRCKECYSWLGLTSLRVITLSGLVKAAQNMQDPEFAAVVLKAHKERHDDLR